MSRLRLSLLTFAALTLLLATPARAELDEKKLKKAKPVSCLGTGTIRVVGKRIATKGVAVDLMGSCTVVVRGSVLRAGKVAISLKGSGTVIIEDSVIRGKQAAISLMGSGTVRVKNSKIFGKISNMGTGTLVDLGGNTFNGKPGKGAAPAPEEKPEAAPPEKPTGEAKAEAAPISCASNDDLTVRNRRIKARGVAVLAQGNCDLTLVNCTIEGKVGVKLQGNADVNLRNCVVKGRKLAALVQGNGTLNAANTVFHGRVSVQGNGDFEKGAGVVIKK